MSWEDEINLCPYCNREEEICDCTEEEIEEYYRELDDEFFDDKAEQDSHDYYS